MTALRRAIAAWGAISFAPIPSSAIRSVEREVQRQSSDQVERIRAELRAALARDDFRDLSRRALAFGLGNADDEAVEAMFPRIIREARRRNDAPSARAVLRAYLRGFEPDESKTVQLAEALSGLRGKLSSARARLIKRFRLTEPHEAINAVARTLVDKEGPADRTLLEASRPSILSSPLGLCAVAAAMVEAASDPNVETYERLLAIMRGPDGKLTPLAKRHAYAALVRPFADGIDPPPLVKKLIQSVIVTEYGDPRLPLTPVPSLVGDPDRAVAHECIAVLKRWLAIDTLNLFIDVISRTAVDRMWKQRRKFWLRYFEACAVSDVHVVFGGDAAAVAKGIRAKEGGGFHWGQLRAALPDQSVLLMVIGELTVAEWSHSGKLRFWRSDTRGKPRLHGSIYEGPDLRKGSISIRNPRTNSVVDGIMHDPAGNWQGFAARVIQTETGIRS